MTRLQVSSLRSPPAYIERAGMASLYWRPGHQAIGHGYDPSPTVSDIAVICVQDYLRWAEVMRRKGAAATVQDRTELKPAQCPRLDGRMGRHPREPRADEALDTAMHSLIAVIGEDTGRSVGPRYFDKSPLDPLTGMAGGAAVLSSAPYVVIARGAV